MGPALASHITRLRLDLGLTCPQVIGLTSSLVTSPTGDLDPFSLLRRNRLILGSDDGTYRPQEIFGNSNSYRFQRLCGELNIERVDVSHTKDGFVWDDFEEEFLQKLRDNLREAPLDLLSQAENFRVRPSKTALQPVLKKAGQSLANDMARTGAQALSIEGATRGILSASEPFIPVASLVASESKFSLLIDDQVWNVVVRTSVDPAVTEMIRVGRTERRQINHGAINDIEVDVSMAHPCAIELNLPPLPFSTTRNPT